MAKNYTSGRIRTANMPNGGQWTNGRFEARIKLPNGSGMWPAFWMLPTDPDIGWPMSGEIDIVEALGQKTCLPLAPFTTDKPGPTTNGRKAKY
jgi:beta-glucanase (GH16 family)